MSLIYEDYILVTAPLMNDSFPCHVVDTHSIHTLYTNHLMLGADRSSQAIRELLPRASGPMSSAADLRPRPATAAPIHR